MRIQFSHLKILNNERGGMAALLSVVVLSIIMVSTLSSFYIYIENRAKFQERIRMNHQMSYVIEDMSRSVIQAREEFMLGQATGAGCPTGKMARWVDCVQVCATSTSTLTGSVPSGVPSHAVCVATGSLNRIINGSDYFCSYNEDGGSARPSSCSVIAENESLTFDSEEHKVAVENIKNSRSSLENWYARLDKFFDTTLVKNIPGVSDSMQGALQAQFKPPTILGWLIPEKTLAAYPITGGGGSVQEDQHCNADPVFCRAEGASVNLVKIGGSTGCTAASTDPRCIRCNGADRNSGACLRFSVCPPWEQEANCLPGPGGVGDRRLHQVVKLQAQGLLSFAWSMTPWSNCNFTGVPGYLGAGSCSLLQACEGFSASGNRSRVVTCVDSVGNVVGDAQCSSAGPRPADTSPCPDSGGADGCFRNCAKVYTGPGCTGYWNGAGCTRVCSGSGAIAFDCP